MRFAWFGISPTDHNHGDGRVRRGRLIELLRVELDSVAALPEPSRTGTPCASVVTSAAVTSGVGLRTVRRTSALPKRSGRRLRHAAGPERAVGELARQLGRPAEASRLEITDPDLAASHYLSLTVDEVLQREHVAGHAVVDGLIRAGVCMSSCMATALGTAGGND
jgi:hypothetical protein